MPKTTREQALAPKRIVFGRRSRPCRHELRAATSSTTSRRIASPADAADRIHKIFYCAARLSGMQATARRLPAPIE